MVGVTNIYLHNVCTDIDSTSIFSIAFNMNYKYNILMNRKYIQDLPYTIDALEPYMSVQTVMLHHKKHEAAYERNLNALYKGDLGLIDILHKYADSNLDQEISIYNNAGQLINHQIYWSSLCPPIENAECVPRISMPFGPLLFAINNIFGSVENLTKEIISKAVKQFGSGWVWLILDQDKNLSVVTTSNAHSPLTGSSTSVLLGFDLWEHAYYLDYTYERAKFVEMLMTKLINWNYAMKCYDAAINSK